MRIALILALNILFVQFNIISQTEKKVIGHERYIGEYEGKLLLVSIEPKEISPKSPDYCSIFMGKQHIGGILKYAKDKLSASFVNDGITFNLKYIPNLEFDELQITSNSFNFSLFKTNQKLSYKTGVFVNEIKESPIVIFYDSDMSYECKTCYEMDAIFKFSFDYNHEEITGLGYASKQPNKFIMQTLFGEELFEMIYIAERDSYSVDYFGQSGIYKFSDKITEVELEKQLLTSGNFSFEEMESGGTCIIESDDNINYLFDITFDRTLQSGIKTIVIRAELIDNEFKIIEVEGINPEFIKIEREFGSSNLNIFGILEDSISVYLQD